ncbi:hypothetical protein C5167_001995 [Papaver somniferum]|uniref:Uncharacterized protein n=1 Tax=Papaver somniferum TaxID=3469 RepID=A0A4Y7KZJ4_PAPSO|nr:hypothetical protein C5167_001995 [Papaver somniferum]
MHPFLEVGELYVTRLSVKQSKADLLNPTRHKDGIGRILLPYPKCNGVSPSIVLPISVLAPFANKSFTQSLLRSATARCNGVRPSLVGASKLAPLSSNSLIISKCPP